MNHTFIRAALVCACLASAACALISNDVEANRTRWNESKIENYRLKVSVVKTGHAEPKKAA